jgi:hypothetical protein
MKKYKVPLAVTLGITMVVMGPEEKHVKTVYIALSLIQRRNIKICIHKLS